MPTCPMCAEDVDAASLVCPHCGAQLKASTATGPATSAAAPAKRALPLWRKVVLGLGVVWVVIVGVTLGVSWIIDAQDARARAAAAEKEQAERAGYLADGRRLAAARDWSGALVALNRAAGSGPLDNAGEALRGAVTTHLVLEAMCGADMDELVRQVVNTGAPFTADGLDSNELRLLNILQSSPTLAAAKAARAERDRLDDAGDDVETSAEASLCRDMASLTSAFDFDPSKLSPLDRAALQRCGTISGGIAASQSRAAEGQRRYAVALAALHADLRRACAGQDPTEAPPTPGPTEPVVLGETDIDGTVLKIESGDYEHIVIVGSKGTESYLLAVDLPDDTRATIAGRRVRAHVVKRRTWVPEAGSESEEYVVTGVVLTGDDSAPDAGSAGASPPDAGPGDDAAPPKAPPEPETILPPPIDWITSNGLTVAKVETTAGQYRACIRAGACDDQVRLPLSLTWEPADAPRAISGVTKEQAVAFCRWIGGRLLTSAEWTRVASNGGKTEFPWPATRGSDPPDCGSTYGPFLGCACAGDVNADGVCDLAGNVHEWVQDGVCGGSYITRGIGLRADNCSAGVAASPGFRCAKGAT